MLLMLLLTRSQKAFLNPHLLICCHRQRALRNISARNNTKGVSFLLESSARKLLGMRILGSLEIQFFSTCFPKTFLSIFATFDIKPSIMFLNLQAHTKKT